MGRKVKKGPVPSKVASEIGRRNSATSPWRSDGRCGSERQRRNWEYFEALAKAGDTRRVPRPELD